MRRNGAERIQGIDIYVVHGSAYVSEQLAPSRLEWLKNFIWNELIPTPIRLSLLDGRIDRWLNG